MTATPTISDNGWKAIRAERKLPADRNEGESRSDFIKRALGGVV